MCCIVSINIYDKKDIGQAKKRSKEVDGEVALPVCHYMWTTSIQAFHWASSCCPKRHISVSHWDAIEGIFI